MSAWWWKWERTPGPQRAFKPCGGSPCWCEHVFCLDSLARAFYAMGFA